MTQDLVREMEQKKTPKADLESKKPLFIEIGLVFTLGITLMAFEWKTYDLDVNDGMQRAVVAIEEDMIIQTDQNTPPPPPPPPAQITTEIEIVTDDKEVAQDFDFNAEADEKTVVEEYVAPSIVVEEEEEEKQIFIIVEESAGYPGGEEGRQKFLQDNLRYPAIARESGIQGTIYITFVVERDGSLTDIKILRGIGGGCDEEAMRVVKLMPKWAPGKQRGKAVRTQFNMPIKFTLAG
jgi:protein TonB